MIQDPGEYDNRFGDGLVEADMQALWNVLYQEGLLTCPTSSWSNYGAGHSGTNGIPTFQLGANPVMGQTVDVLLGNSLGATTPSLQMVGFGTASVPLWGGTLLVQPRLFMSTVLPPSGLVAPLVVPFDHALCFLNIYTQSVQVDPGAVGGFSFSPGLSLQIGLD